MRSHRFPVLVALLLIAAPMLAACGDAADGQADGSSHRYSGIDTDSENDTNPPPADLVGRSRCDTTDSGLARATGSVVNHSSKPSEYDIGVEFSTPDGRFATGHAHVSELGHGRTMEWVVVIDASPPAHFTCEVVEVQRYAS
jgi:hypothetical protein